MNPRTQKEGKSSLLLRDFKDDSTVSRKKTQTVPGGVLIISSAGGYSDENMIVVSKWR